MEKFSNNATLDTLESDEREHIRKAAAALGRLGGSKKSEAKTRSCRANAQKRWDKQLKKGEKA